MALLGQIKGMLLEEVLLHLLRASGYSTIEKVDKNDSTIQQGKAGLELLGRGGVHQIDAIADFAISPPFSNPQRLLVEAKCLNQSVGIPVVRNAVGVLKDVGEYWISRNGAPAKARYHYQYALFSAEGYTEPAQRYAYAQDVYLIPLENSKFIQPIIEAIKALTKDSFGAESDRKINVDLGRLRRSFREVLRRNSDNIFDVFEEPSLYEAIESLLNIRRIAQRIDNAMIAMISKQFPVFLVPSNETTIQDLIDNPAHSVRIFWEENGWYIEPTDNHRSHFRFSFDIPTKLLELYSEQGLLSKERALDLKSEQLSQMEALFVVDNEPRLIRFQLDRNWIDGLRERR